MVTITVRLRRAVLTIAAASVVALGSISSSLAGDAELGTVLQEARCPPKRVQIIEEKAESRVYKVVCASETHREVVVVCVGDSCTVSNSIHPQEDGQ